MFHLVLNSAKSTVLLKIQPPSTFVEMVQPSGLSLRVWFALTGRRQVANARETAQRSLDFIRPCIFNKYQEY